MNKINVYTHYDNNKTVIGKIIPNEKHQITEKTYKKLLKERTIGGTAGIYTDAEYDIYVVDKNGNIIACIR